MGIEAPVRSPRTSKAGPGHKVYAASLGRRKHDCRTTAGGIKPNFGDPWSLFRSTLQCSVGIPLSQHLKTRLDYNMDV